MTNNLAQQAVQRAYCINHNLPLFAPPSGICYNCRRNIYDYMTIEDASSKHITGCPHCHYSFCE